MYRKGGDSGWVRQFNTSSKNLCITSFIILSQESIVI